MRRGSNPTTGRYPTRAELVREVWFWHVQRGLDRGEVARITKVSLATINRIISSKEGYPF